MQASKSFHMLNKPKTASFFVVFYGASCLINLVSEKSVQRQVQLSSLPISVSFDLCPGPPGFSTIFLQKRYLAILFSASYHVLQP